MHYIMQRAPYMNTTPGMANADSCLSSFVKNTAYLDIELARETSFDNPTRRLKFAVDQRTMYEQTGDLAGSTSSRLLVFGIWQAPISGRPSCEIVA